MSTIFDEFCRETTAFINPTDCIKPLSEFPEICITTFSQNIITEFIENNNTTCRNKTRVKIRIDTELKNFPLFCPKCKQESLINVKKQQIIVIEPDAKTQSR